MVVLIFQAKKFFPYGFGPGDRVQILDAADSDDDEDEGGKYQVLECKDISPWGGEGGGASSFFSFNTHQLP